MPAGQEEGTSLRGSWCTPGGRIEVGSGVEVQEEEQVKVRPGVEVQAGARMCEPTSSNSRSQFFRIHLWMSNLWKAGITAACLDVTLSCCDVVII